MSHKIIALLSALLFSFAPVNADFSPWLFNVYAIDSIGTPAQAYGSSIQGIVGAGNNAYFNGASIHSNAGAGPGTAYSLYTGGKAVWTSGNVQNGGIDAGGNVTISSTSVNGNISSGGKLTGTSGNISGNVTLAQTNQASPSLTISGTLQENTPYTPSINLSAVSAFFQNASSTWAAMSTNVLAVNNFGQLLVTVLTPGMNFLNLTAAQFNSYWGMNFIGTNASNLVINITDTNFSGTLNNLVYSFTGGMTSSNLLVNANSATNILISGQNASLLAPNALITFPSGQVTGNLVANNLRGAGSVVSGSFSGFASIAVPEPSTYLILGSMLLICIYAARRKINITA
ncbi:MAG: collagen-binding domain-containing protein [Parachlamydiales bacterium]|jgi:choice-of-anchor A domain-containing protein